VNENIKNGKGTIEDQALCHYALNRNREELKSLRSKLATCRREYLELEERYEKLTRRARPMPLLATKKRGRKHNDLDKATQQR
jgi:3-methyladenine DNA glycosylase/8-oxoguanine DNA glycosylase